LLEAALELKHIAKGKGGQPVDVRIGVQYSSKELEVDMGDGVDKDAIQTEIEKVLAGGSPVLWLTDKKGRKVGVVTDKVAYVEIGAEGSERRMGFVG
jgi:hypothetical protein